MPGLAGDGDELDINHKPAAPACQRLQKRRGGDLPDILRRYGDGGTEEQTPVVQGIHVGDELVVNACAASGIGGVTTTSML
jgi:hypothetical protein